MIRRIIEIDEEKCNGCGLCAQACHEQAIILVDGKARLIKDDYCDGLGDCLPTCPTGAISFVHREAAPYDAETVKARLQNTREEAAKSGESMLRQWPVQIKLVPTNAPYFENAQLLVAADCSAFSHPHFHEQFMKDKITLIGCPKLDSIDYSEKLSEIIRQNSIKNITVVRMEVPCCSGLEHAVKTALINSQKMIPWQVIILSIEGQILQNI